MCFVWIWEQTAIISLYNINWLVFITEAECLLRGTDWMFKCNSGNLDFKGPTPSSVSVLFRHLRKVSAVGKEYARSAFAKWKWQLQCLSSSWKTAARSNVMWLQHETYTVAIKPEFHQNNATNSVPPHRKTPLLYHKHKSVSNVYGNNAPLYWESNGTKNWLWVYNTRYFHVREVARMHARTHTGVPYRDTQINPYTVLGVTPGTKETR